MAEAARTIHGFSGGTGFPGLLLGTPGCYVRVTVIAHHAACFLERPGVRQEQSMRGSAMPERGLKQMAADRDLKVGHFIVEFATPGIGQIIKAAGCDFAVLDTEHSGFGYETMKSALRYMQAADLPTIVRVPSKAYHHIARAADMGAEGIMVPMVNSAEEARQILDSMKYVPQGRRGVALQIAHDRYAPGPVLDKLAAANRFTTCFAQIETRAGVDNADEIAALDGVDCIST
jgi:2-keto-3-deoxy-L-rhamnonate aldolase RhmA